LDAAALIGMRKTFVGLKCLDHPGKEVPEFLIKEKTAGTDLMEQVREVIPAVSAREGLITHQIFFQPGGQIYALTVFAQEKAGPERLCFQVLTRDDLDIKIGKRET